MVHQGLEASRQSKELVSEMVREQNMEEMAETNLSSSILQELMEKSLSYTTEGSMEDAYSDWMVSSKPQCILQMLIRIKGDLLLKRNHPSALGKFDLMMSTVKEKKVVIFLDYDGTLSPIVDDPDQAFMTDSMRSTLNKVAQYFPSFIISGRRRDKVYDFVQLANVYYVGSHGMDIMAPTKTSKSQSIAFNENSIDQKENEAILFQPARDFLPIIDQIFIELKEKTKNIHGVLVENNKFCISVHFRRVNEDDWSVLEEQVISIAKKYTDLHLTRGKKVIEIRPSIKWDKGCALEYILDNLGFGISGEAIPLYIGDDKTDEDAFKVLQKRGHGYSILVSSIPKDTMASYSLRDPSEVMSFLLSLARWKRNSSNGGFHTPVSLSLSM